MNDNVERLRTKFRDFYYDEYSFSYSGNELKLQYVYRIGDEIIFRPNITLKNINESILRNNDSLNTENFIFNIGMVVLLSYWKTTASPRIIVKAAQLTDWQIAWWEDFYQNGMGQYFYENSIDFTKPNYFRIISDSERNVRTKPVKVESEKVLVPVAGGKDSAVTLTLLDKNLPDVEAFIMKPVSGAASKVIKMSGVKNTLIAEHNLDPLMLEMNNKGFLNGHTPYSGLLAFLGTFASLLTGSKHIAFSNEYSSNEANLSYLNTEVNHQYSKSFEFEQKFREYNSKVLSDINYFSFLRPLYELQIAQLFSKLDEHYPVIRSCNRGQKDGVWCSQCPKCLSTFLLLFPFLGKEKIINVFPQDLFQDKDLKNILKSMVNPLELKPFECVGTREESKVALYLSLLRYGGAQLPVLLQYAKDELLINERDMKERSIKILTSWNRDNFLTKEFSKILKEAVSPKNNE